MRRSNPRRAGKSPTTPAWLFFMGIMTGTLAEKVERDVRAYPDDYIATGQWLDKFCSLKKHGSRLKEKLLQKKKEYDESGIQKEVAKLKRKARTAGKKKAREAANKAAEKVAQRRQSRKNDLTILKKKIKAVEAYLKTPKGESPVANFVLIFEAWEYICSEDPQDIKKILLIFWLLTDRFTETTGPGLTRFEKWSYGDDRACADPEEQFGTRHWTLEELLSRENQMIPMVEAAMRATARNKKTKLTETPTEPELEKKTGKEPEKLPKRGRDKDGRGILDKEVEDYLKKMKYEDGATGQKIADYINIKDAGKYKAVKRQGVEGTKAYQEYLGPKTTRTREKEQEKQT